MAKFDWRGHTIHTAVMPYRFYLLQRLTDTFESLDPPDKTAIEKLFEGTDLASILNLKATRRVVRENHLEGWA